MDYIFHTDFIVDYNYVDKHSKLTYSGFLKYLLDAGSRHSDSVGLGFEKLQEKHLAWLILGWKLEIYRRPTTDEKIHIETWSSGAERVCTYRDYKVFDANHNLIAIATSKWVLYNLAETTLTRITSDITDLYKTTSEANVFSEKMAKLTEPTSSCLNTYDYSIMRRDIDTNNHVHNSIYLDIASEVLPEDIYETEFKKIEIMYKTQALYRDKTTLLYYTENNEHFVVIKSSDLSKLHCIIKLG